MTRNEILKLIADELGLTMEQIRQGQFGIQDTLHRLEAIIEEYMEDAEEEVS